MHLDYNFTIKLYNNLQKICLVQAYTLWHTCRFIPFPVRAEGDLPHELPVKIVVVWRLWNVENEVGGTQIKYLCTVEPKLQKQTAEDKQAVCHTQEPKYCITKQSISLWKYEILHGFYYTLYLMPRVSKMTFMAIQECS